MRASFAIHLFAVSLTACGGSQDLDLFDEEGLGLTGTCQVPAAYPTISRAVGVGCEIIQVAAGTYAEQFAIGNSVEIIGAGDRQTVLVGSITVKDNAPRFYLRGVTVKGSVVVESSAVKRKIRLEESGFEGSGVSMSWADAVIQKNRFESNLIGLSIGQGADAVVANNVFSRNGLALEVTPTIDFLNLRNNSFSWNTTNIRAVGGLVAASRHSTGANHFHQPSSDESWKFSTDACWSSAEGCVGFYTVFGDPGFVGGAQITAGWTTAGSMAVVRGDYTYWWGAARLGGGRILAAGGFFNTATAAVDLFDPTTLTWTRTADMTVPRHFHAVAELAGGHAFVTGGVGHSSAELYIASSAVWQAKASMSVRRQGHTLHAIPGTAPDAKFLAVGGYDGSNVHTSAEIFEGLTTNTWTTVPMIHGRERHVAVTLTGGHILVAAGYGPGTGTAEFFDPATRSFSITGTPAFPLHVGVSLVALPDGRALATGYHQAQLYDPATNAWTAVAAPPNKVWNSAAVLLDDGRVLVTGGWLDGVGPTSLTVAYDPTANAWTELSPAPSALSNHAALSLGDGRVAVFGRGQSTYVFRPSTASGPVDYHLAAGSPLINTGDTAILDQDRGRSDIGMYGGRLAQVRYASVSPSKVTVTTKVKFSCFFVDLKQPRSVEVLLGGGLATIVATSTDTWPANDATYVAYLQSPPVGKFSYRCRALTFDSRYLYFPALGSYKYFTVDPDLTTVTLTPPAGPVPSTQTLVTVDVKTTASTYGYTVRVYFSKDGVTFAYKTATRIVKDPAGDTYRVTLTRGTNFSAGTVHLYGYGRDANGPTIYAKNGTTNYTVTIQ